MKKYMFTMLVLFIFSSVHSQTQDIKLGVKAGLNVTNIIDSENNIKEPKIAFNAGVLAEFFVLEKFSIQPEIIYSSQGFRVSYDSGPYPYSDHNSVIDYHTLDYINIPIIAKYYVYDGINVQAGPKVGYLIRESDNNSIISRSNSIYNTVDFGIGLGLGYESSIGAFIDIRYNFGLTNIVKKEYVIENTNYKHQVIQLSVGYKF